MGEKTGGAVLDAFIVIDEIPSASLAQHIERAVAEKTVEVFPVCTCMAGKEFALFVAKIGIFFFFPVLIQTGSPQAPVWELVMRNVPAVLPLPSWQLLQHPVCTDPHRWLHSIPVTSEPRRS